MTKSITQILIDKWEGNAPAIKEEYRNKLKHGLWIVEFKKIDGTPSTMECTLDTAYLPLPTSTMERTEQEHLLHVYSTDRKGWRSFVVGNVTNFYRKPEGL